MGTKYSTYVDLTNQVGSYIDFKMVSLSATTKSFQVRFAASSNGTIDVSVNGAGSQTELFSSTGGNSSFSINKWITLTLQPVINTMRFTSENSVGSPNFDWIKVQ